MKFNWGAGIASVIIIFALGVGLLVYIAASQRIDLVADDYYGQELRHQERIDQSRRSSAMKEKIAIRPSGRELRVIFPAIFEAEEIAGSMTLYRPSDRTKDAAYRLKLDRENSQTVNTSALEKGLWRLKIKWEYRDEEYYFEEVVVIN